MLRLCRLHPGATHRLQLNMSFSWSDCQQKLAWVTVGQLWEIIRNTREWSWRHSDHHTRLYRQISNPCAMTALIHSVQMAQAPDYAYRGRQSSRETSGVSPGLSSHDKKPCSCAAVTELTCLNGAGWHWVTVHSAHS